MPSKSLFTGEELGEPPAEGADESTFSDGMIEDVVTGKPLKETPKEIVRQRIARALLNEYGFDAKSLALDYSVKGAGTTRKSPKVDIAVFHSGKEQLPENLSRVVVCRPEPKQGARTVRIRDHEQAQTDIAELEKIMDELPGCTLGLWTNGLESYFIRKEEKRFENVYHPIGDWPLADGSQATLSDQPSLRPADSEMLKIAFRRCHNFIHGNEGMPKDAAFWQFLYLIFCKLYDEDLTRRTATPRRFFVGAKEIFTEDGRRAIRQRIDGLFREVKESYSQIFRATDEITLSNRALEFMVSELAKYDFSRTGMDAKGAAYQEIVGNNLRGDRGQYFTPRGVIDLAVKILDPRPGERVLDPSCGTGGFLVATLDHQLKRFEREAKIQQATATTEEFLPVQERLREYASECLFGADFDPFLIRATQMNMVMAGDGRGHLYHLNSLEFPKGYLPGRDQANEDIPLESIDVILTNPPFGADIPITDPHILQQYELATQWESTGTGAFRSTGIPKKSVAPEILFIERYIQWLRPGGRVGVVLPNGILGNPAMEYIRWWILHHCYVLASVDLPVEVFIVEANVNVLTSLLFLKKKTKEQIMAEALSAPVEYPVFMAVAEKVGFDRRGKTLYKREPNGEEIWEIKGKRRERIPDNDLPVIADEYQKFRGRFPEPGGLP